MFVFSEKREENQASPGTQNKGHSRSLMYQKWNSAVMMMLEVKNQHPSSSTSVNTARKGSKDQFHWHDTVVRYAVVSVHVSVLLNVKSFRNIRFNRIPVRVQTKRTASVWTRLFVLEQADSCLKSQRNLDEKKHLDTSPRYIVLRSPSAVHCATRRLPGWRHCAITVLSATPPLLQTFVTSAGRP